MKKLPFYLRLGFAIMGVDPYAQPVEQPQQATQTPGATADPTSQIAWVPTNIDLPELYKEVTIYTTDKEILYGWARVNETDYIHSKDERTINNVTHWMYIESPKTVEQKKQDTAQPTSQIASKPRMPR